MMRFEETGITALLLTAVGFASPAAARLLPVPSACSAPGSPSGDPRRRRSA